MLERRVSQGIVYKSRKINEAIKFATKAPYNAQLVKMADIFDNCRNLAQQDPEFAKIYFEEKRLLIDGLRPEITNTIIYKMVMAVLVDI